jgi:AcrR family transcriptional regulator
MAAAGFAELVTRQDSDKMATASGRRSAGGVRPLHPPASRPATFRAPGIARRARLLAAARELLGTHELDALSLADVATRARIPKGSSYHYYSDIMDLYAHLLAVIQEEMLEDLRRPLRRSAIGSWEDVIAALIRRGVRYYEEQPAARQLILSAKAPPELKLRDRHSDIRIGKVFEQHIDACFVLPKHAGREAIFFRAVEIADLMFALSILEHGRITEEMTEEAVRGMAGYLRTHIPGRLPERDAPAPA